MKKTFNQTLEFLSKPIIMGISAGTILTGIIGYYSAKIGKKITGKLFKFLRSKKGIVIVIITIATYFAIKHRNSLSKWFSGITNTALSKLKAIDASHYLSKILNFLKSKKGMNTECRM